MLELMGYLKNSVITRISFMSYYERIYIDSASNLRSSFFDYLLRNSEFIMVRSLSIRPISDSINYV